MAALDPSDLPAILLHVEGLARSMGIEHLELQVPAPNEVAMRHLLGRGYRLDPWINLLMSDRPFGQFDRFIPFSPPAVPLIGTLLPRGGCCGLFCLSGARQERRSWNGRSVSRMSATQPQQLPKWARSQSRARRWSTRIRSRHPGSNRRTSW